ncbi:capsular biosynthesis protein [Halovenus sp. WSH3]|uniref:Capsular biosynthesis protein n=1 Tax=Halovenus carboxidivorans TaxID=2692199 RepID=A0A6B0SYZ1_9EURY|nr:poly-gamma-glutamate biosynthesis protein PgsC/CapC [Halovenus carboxidivorans]MXR50357.1 capsular biosynthesis protein [Halovenus carboxidivorans]
MRIATVIMLLGLLAGIAGSQLAGLRLGGVMIVPLVTVYFFLSFATFPVFVLSVIAAYVSLWIIKRRLLLYGRYLFIVSVLVGALVPVLVFDQLVIIAGIDAELTQIEFVGSVLPGIAAYNYHRIDDERRVLDMVASLAVVLFLTVVGIGLVILVGLTPLATVTPPLLLSPESDIAAAFDLTVTRSMVPVIASDGVVAALLIGGTALSEGVRSRYGLRIAGVVVVPLIVLAMFRNSWMLGLWIGSTALAYLSIRALHWWTLLYGRVLLAFAFIIGLIVSISATVAIPVRHGLLPFFVGLFAGVTAYNFYLVPPAERRAAVLVTGGAVVLLAAVARLLVSPPPRGLLHTVSQLDLLVGAAVLVAAGYELSQLERLRPHQSIDVQFVDTK